MTKRERAMIDEALKEYLTKLEKRLRARARVITCQYCGREFVAFHGKRRYCSASCCVMASMKRTGRLK